MPKEPGRISASVGVGFVENAAASSASIHAEVPEQFQLPRFIKFKLLVRVFAYIKISTAVLVAALKVFAICAVASESQNLLCGLMSPTQSSGPLIAYVSVLHASMTWETQVILSMVRLISRFKEENYELTKWNIVELNTDLLEYPVLFILFSIAKFNEFTLPKHGGVCPIFAYTIVTVMPVIVGISIAFLIISLSYRQFVRRLNASAASGKTRDTDTAEVGTMAKGEEVVPT